MWLNHAQEQHQQQNIKASFKPEVFIEMKLASTSAILLICFRFLNYKSVYVFLQENMRIFMIILELS